MTLISMQDKTRGTPTHFLRFVLSALSLHGPFSAVMEGQFLVDRRHLSYPMRLFIPRVLRILVHVHRKQDK